MSKTEAEVQRESSASGGAKVAGVSKSKHQTKAARAVADPDSERQRAIDVEVTIDREGVDQSYIDEFVEGKPELQADLAAAEDFSEAVREADAKVQSDYDQRRADKDAALAKAQKAKTA